MQSTGAGAPGPTLEEISSHRPELGGSTPVSSVPPFVFSDGSKDAKDPMSPEQLAKGGRSLGNEKGIHFGALSSSTGGGGGQGSVGDVPGQAVERPLQARAFPQLQAQCASPCPSPTQGARFLFLLKVEGADGKYREDPARSPASLPPTALPHGRETPGHLHFCLVFRLSTAQNSQ